MVTVEADVDQVERRLAAGELSCPACRGVLAGWGRARPRLLRGPDGPVLLCPRRSRCTGCRVTHVLLPVSVLLRRADAAAVVMSALAAKAVRRVGFRRIAAELARARRRPARAAGARSRAQGCRCTNPPGRHRTAGDSSHRAPPTPTALRHRNVGPAEIFGAASPQKHDSLGGSASCGVGHWPSPMSQGWLWLSVHVTGSPRLSDIKRFGRFGS